MDCTWIVLRLYVVCACSVPESYLDCTWIVPILSLHCTENVPGLNLVCARNLLELHTDCTRIVLGMHIQYKLNLCINEKRSRVVPRRVFHDEELSKDGLPGACVPFPVVPAHGRSKPVRANYLGQGNPIPPSTSSPWSSCQGSGGQHTTSRKQTQKYPRKGVVQA